MSEPTVTFTDKPDTGFYALNPDVRIGADSESFSISFLDSNSKWVLAIKADGTIEIGEGYTPTEAGDEFIAALPGVIHRHIEAAEQAAYHRGYYAGHCAASEPEPKFGGHHHGPGGIFDEGE